MCDDDGIRNRIDAFETRVRAWENSKGKAAEKEALTSAKLAWYNLNNSLVQSQYDEADAAEERARTMLERWKGPLGI
jgi:hypothetical protein